MTINQMRIYILDSYPNASMDWRNKVANKMPTNQIIAIYHSILAREDKKQKQAKIDEQFHQMDIFEWQKALAERNGDKETHTDIL